MARKWRVISDDLGACPSLTTNLSTPPCISTCSEHSLTIAHRGPPIGSAETKKEAQQQLI